MLTMFQSETNDYDRIMGDLSKERVEQIVHSKIVMF